MNPRPTSSCDAVCRSGIADTIKYNVVGEVASKLALRVNGDFAKQNHLAPPVSFIADFGHARLALQGVFCRQE